MWRFDGAVWEARSGPGADAPDSLIDVPVHVLAADPDPGHRGELYAGADLGVWRSLDGGRTWSPFVAGLPHAPIADLLLHGPSRRLRAATHGRGVYERRLDGAPQGPVSLYVRAHARDVGGSTRRDRNVDAMSDGAAAEPWMSPDIKVDVPTSDGDYQVPSGHVDYYDFCDKLVEVTGVGAAGSPWDPDRVYVAVHNEGPVPVSAQVTLLLTTKFPPLPPLPDGYDASIRAGAAVETPDWKTVGTARVDAVSAGAPRVARFDLPPSGAGGKRPYRCFLALVHAPEESL